MFVVTGLARGQIKKGRGRPFQLVAKKGNEKESNQKEGPSTSVYVLRKEVAYS